jgi:ABC-2 type transport system permease protein
MRFWAIVVKEVHHILRDYRTLLVLFILPVLQLLLLGYAMDTEPHHITLAINDYDRSVKSRELIDSLSASSLFSLLVTEVPAASLFTEREAEAVLVIQKGYERELFRKRVLALSLEIDAADSQRAQSVAGYVEGAVAGALG